MLMDIPRLKRMMVRVLCWRMVRKIIRRLLIWLIRRNRIWLFGGIRLCDFVCLMISIVVIIDHVSKTNMYIIYDYLHKPNLQYCFPNNPLYIYTIDI